MKHFLPIASLCILLFSSCNKDDAPHNYATAGPYNTMDDAYKSAAPIARNTSMIVSAGGSVSAAGGARFIFPPNAFITKSGSSVTGSVDVQVNDWLKKGDMIFGKVLPISNNQSLESGGQAFVQVTQNGQPVFLKNGMQVQINLPQFGKSVPGMLLFTGKAVTGAANTVQWQGLDSVSGGRIVYNGDTISMFADSVGYCNADRFMSMPNYQVFTVNATTPSGSLDGTPFAYALFDSYKAMWPIDVPSASHVPDIPVHLVVMGLKNGDFYAGISAVTPKSGSTYTVNLTKTDPIAFKQTLNGL